MTPLLPNAWVERIFAKLQGVYGREFIGQYSTGAIDGVDAGLENAKLAWGEELGSYIRNPDAIAYALEHLPERAPNAIRFRELCRAAPKPKPPELEAKFTPQQIEENKNRIREVLKGLHGKTLLGDRCEP